MGNTLRKPSTKTPREIQNTRGNGVGNSGMRSNTETLALNKSVPSVTPTNHNHQDKTLQPVTTASERQREGGQYNKNGSTLPFRKNEQVYLHLHLHLHNMAQQRLSRVLCGATSVQQLRKMRNTLTVHSHNNRTMAAPTNTVRREAYRTSLPARHQACGRTSIMILRLSLE